MNHPWCLAIIPRAEQIEIYSAMHGIELSLMSLTAVTRILPEWLDIKFGDVEGS